MQVTDQRNNGAFDSPVMTEFVYLTVYKAILVAVLVVVITILLLAFSALTLLIGHQEEHPTWKN